MLSGGENRYVYQAKKKGENNSLSFSLRFIVLTGAAKKPRGSKTSFSRFQGINND